MSGYMAKFALNSKTVYVAGGAGLIGAEICRAAASLGARVIIADVDSSRAKALAHAIAKSGGDAVYARFDITRLEGMERQLQALFKAYGPCHAWVNAAYPRTKDWPDSVEKLTLASWRKNVDMHLNGYIWTSRAVALWMKKSKIKGSLVNLGSIYGVVANDFTVYEGTSLTSPMAYSAIKGGIISGTRYLAAYFGPSGIRCNTVCPGGVFDGQNKRFVKQYEHKVPLKRMGTPADTAAAVVYLLSDAASYITGSSLMVDGGWAIV